MTTDSLIVTRLTASYGRVQVVNDVTLHVDPAEMVALVGRNGVGKTTALLSIAGLKYGPSSGSVRIGADDVSRATPHAIVRRGLTLIPEGHRIFKEMTVHDNLELGAFPWHRSGRALLASELQRVYDLFPGLATYNKKRVGELSGGQQQMVAVGQALMSRPKFLLLDEPTAGLAPALIDELYDAFRQLVVSGIGVLIVDQSIDRALERSDRFLVMDNGSIVFGGTSEPEARNRVNAIVLGGRGTPA